MGVSPTNTFSGNDKIAAFVSSIKNKKIAVVGLGRSNVPLILFLLSYTNNICGFDKTSRENLPEELLKTQESGVRFFLGEDYLTKLTDFDLIFRTPGMHPHNPFLVKAVENGAVLSSEMELFFELCPAKIIGVTGSDGKTTTTTLIYTMLREEGINCYLGGNIGRPLISDLEKMRSEDIAVVELSSFQLMTMKRSPHISVITNITPNHLDVHKSYEEYISAKENIFRHQKEPHCKVVLNFDNPVTRGFIKGLENAFPFSRIHSLEKGVMVSDNKIYIADQGDKKEILSIDEILLPGVHNVENYLAAISAVYGLVKKETIQSVAKTFKGVEHRIELVREFQGIKIYNDSIASSPSRTIAGLRSFHQKVILIAGGCDKKLSYEDLGNEILERVKGLVLVGQTAPKIEEAFQEARRRLDRGWDIPLYRATGFEEAVEQAVNMASPGDVVILSPASTSFDMFKNFEERGQRFKDIVMKL